MITCPGCNGNLKFDIASQMLHCDFCDSSYDVYAFDNKTSDVEERHYETTIYTCPQCGGELESTDTDVTGFCPFCGASDIFYSRISDELMPDYIIPFKKTKEDCKKLYQNKARKALFLPKEYKDAKYVDGFRGIYVPYWAYNITQKGHVSFKGEKTHREGDYIVHEHFNLSGDIDSFYNGLSHDASSSFSDDISERIEPFDIKEKQEFTAGFLSGFYADTADVTSDTYKNSEMDVAKRNSRTQIRREKTFAPYSIEGLDNNNLNTEVVKVDRTMYPVWFMSYRNKDRVAYATVNGQTGKVSADFPIDVTKFLLFAGVVAVIIFMLLNMFFTFKPATVSFLTALIALATVIVYFAERSAIQKWESNVNDRGYMAGSRLKSKDLGYKGSVIPMIPSAVAMVISGLCWLGDSINDFLHYSVASACSVGIAITLICLIKDFNRLATRPLPQFNRKGGDDDAE